MRIDWDNIALVIGAAAVLIAASFNVRGCFEASQAELATPRCVKAEVGARHAVVCREHNDIRAGTYVLVEVTP